MSHRAHESAAAGLQPRVAILTLSDTRSLATDTSGDALVHELSAQGCVLADRALIRDDEQTLREQVRRWLDDPTIDAIVTTGGTGIAPRDRTIEVIDTLIDIPLPGFGELFRALSYQQIGAAAMLSRAVGGIARTKPIFALPGSTAAVTLAARELIGPQLRHLMSQLRRHG